MDETVMNLLRELRAGLRRIYGDRFKAVYLSRGGHSCVNQETERLPSPPSGPASINRAWVKAGKRTLVIPIHGTRVRECVIRQVLEETGEEVEDQDRG